MKAEKTGNSQKNQSVDVGVHIRAEILQRKGLNTNEKLILSAVIQLHKSNGECFASNPYFSRWLGMPQGTIEDNISKLVRKALMSRKIEYSGKQVKRRILTPNFRLLRLKKKTMQGVSRKSGYPHPKKGVDKRE